MTNHTGTKLDFGALFKDGRYEYQTLTSSRPYVADGDFAFATEINFGGARVDKGLYQQHFLDVTITSQLFSGSRYQNVGDVTHSGRIKIGGTSISQTISTLAAPKRLIFKRSCCSLSIRTPRVVADCVMYAYRRRWYSAMMVFMSALVRGRD